MKVALIQFNATADKDDNIRRAFKMVEQAIAGGAGFVLLPEVFIWRGNTRDKALLGKAAERVPGPTVKLFMGLAAKHNTAILLGSLFEKGPLGRVYNTSVLIGRDGTILEKYRKIHLFDAKIGDRIIREAECFVAGRQSITVKLDDVTVGLSICYDLRFPELYRRYSKIGAEILTVPACFTKKTGQAHWEVLLRARAIENLCWVLGPNQVGADARGVESYGNSMIVSPWGEVIARGSDANEEIVYGEITREAVAAARNILPGIYKAANVQPAKESGERHG